MGGAVTASLGAALLLALALQAADGGGDPPQHGGAALRVRAEPSTVVLGPRARASILVEGAGGEPPAVTASVGRVAAIRAVGTGTFAADWIAPEDAWPQVAILSAISGGRAGWIALPLVGTGLAVAHAEPGSSIKVTIGDALFGPVRADRSGEARVRVVVPPGVTKARHGADELDLDVPATLHVHLATDRALAGAERDQVVTLRVFAVDPAGGPRAAAPVELSVSEGRVEVLSEVSPGSWIARWTLPAGAAASAQARASLRDEPGREAAVVVARPAGPPARISVEPSVDRAVAGGDERVLLRVRVTDAAGNPVGPPAPPRVEASFGNVRAVDEVERGTFVAALELPVRRDGRRRADVTVAAGELSAAAAVELAPGAPARLVLAAPDAPVIADGTREARLRVQVLDQFGNEVEDAVPSVSASARAEVGAEREEGGWTVRYRPARVRADARQDVVVRAGPLAAATTLQVIAPAQRLVVAPKVGFAASSGGLRSAYLAAEGCFWTAWQDGRVGVALEVGTFDLDRTDRVTAGASTVILAGESRYVPVLASVAWDGGALGPGRWWISAGAGAALVTSTLTVDGAAVHDAGWAAAAHATGGWGLRLGAGTAFAEARLAWHGNPGLETLSGSMTAFVLSAGYRWVAY